MPFREADDRDVWLRHLLLPGQIRGGKKIHPKIIANCMKPPQADDVPWAEEVSGRLLSLANDIVEYAEEQARGIREAKPHTNAAFQGVIYQRALVIRAIPPEDMFNVYHQDTPADPAHANLTSREALPRVDGKISHDVVRAITDKLEVAPAGSEKLRELLAK